MMKDGLKVFGAGFAKAKQFPVKGKAKTRLSWKLKLSLAGQNPVAASDG